jgi:hypothetical protein
MDEDFHAEYIYHQRNNKSYESLCLLIFQAKYCTAQIKVFWVPVWKIWYVLWPGFLKGTSSHNFINPHLSYGRVDDQEGRVSIKR